MISEIWEASQASVIGALLIDPEAVAGQVLRTVTPEDFSGEYRTAYEAIRAVWGSGARIDPVVVLDRLGEG